MTRYMLDTNTVSHLLKKHPAVARRVVEVPLADLCISAITQGELLFGLARRPLATALHDLVLEFLRRVEVLPWDSTTAPIYGTARASLQSEGKTLSPMDLLIGTHALSLHAILVTNDRAFSQVAGLSIEDWTDDRG
ncbi:MAG TPA: type II toxin-antitoxin system VapC family toxin [Burkholderiaceae bacterium]|jgi:tRNA(fMet)-specific endonuclease VapC|nr:type II toxin-antitoxin system VapC family toxin [Burkholderiaceae bacterium]